jgi:hypothetical protein
VMIFGSQPVKTDLIFDTLDKCLAAEERMRAEYASQYNSWLAWAKQAGRLQDEAHQRHRLGLENRATCIPHAGPATKFGLAGATHNA